MKKNFNLKLTLALVSLFVSLILIVVGNKNNYCLSFGFILMGVALALYTMSKSEELDKYLIEIKNAMEETDPQETFTLNQLEKDRKKINKQKASLNSVFYITAVLLVIVGFYFMF